MSAPAEYQRPHLSSDLSSAVVRLVEEQGLREGDALQPLRALAARFSVAVPTMREALRRLEGLGIVELRHGSGIYVGPNAGRRVLANPVAGRADVPALLELLQARAAIEPSIARMAAQVRDPRGLAWLQECVAAASRQIRDEQPGLWRSNIDLHRAIATTSGNAILAELLDSLVLVHADDQRAILELHGGIAEDFAEHEELVRLIAAGSADAAYRAAHDHLEHVIEVLLERTAPALQPEEE